MAFAKKCDRCGKLYEPYNGENDCKKINGIMILNIGIRGKYYGHGPIDLCPKCKESFNQWLFAGKPAGEIEKEV